MSFFNFTIFVSSNLKFSSQEHNDDSSADYWIASIFIGWSIGSISSVSSSVVLHRLEWNMWNVGSFTRHSSHGRFSKSVCKTEVKHE